MGLVSRTVFVSSHADDAIFSCGSLISALRVTADVLVVTVCAGYPPPDVEAPLDVSAGFRDAREAVTTRRAEDAEACSLFGAEVLHLDVLDYQYERALRPVGDQTAYDIERYARIAFALEPVLEAADVVIAPVGVRHPDHLAVAAACKPFAHWLYEDLPYRVLWPEAVPVLGEAVFTLPCSEQKFEAVRCYRSQLGGEPGEELLAAERYHLGAAQKFKKRFDAFV